MATLQLNFILRLNQNQNFLVHTDSWCQLGLEVEMTPVLSSLCLVRIPGLFYCSSVFPLPYKNLGERFKDRKASDSSLRSRTVMNSNLRAWEPKS